MAETTNGAANGQAQQQNAQKIVGDSVIRAPFAGIVGERDSTHASATITQIPNAD